MLVSAKNFLLFLFFGLLFGSAYAVIRNTEGHELANKGLAQDSLPAMTDTTQQLTTSFPIKKLSPNTYEELNATYPLDAPQPSNVKSVLEYDIKTGNYLLRTFVGENEITTPLLMTAEEYKSYSAKKEMQSYWKEKNTKEAVNNENKFSISDMKFNIGPADKVFGPGGVQIKTQGSAELLFGFKSNKVDNPSITEQMRKSTIFDFNEKIQMNVNGTVGDKVTFALNYNTESGFTSDQKMVKLAYTGKEDDIIKSIEAGNVSLPLSSSLITGSAALFGIKTELQFGRLNVTAVVSQQESQTQTVSSKGGAQTTEFDIGADDYDANRHFFLAHYFRDNYENAMKTLPYISSGVVIGSVEVWITNKRANYDQARNIVAFMDLGERDSLNNAHWKDVTVINTLPNNNSNKLYAEMRDTAKIPNITLIRDIQQTETVLSSYFTQYGINGGEDYEKVESARKLSPSEYTLNPTLGIISLRTPINPSDEVLAVSYEYTYAGNVYQVGEFSTDGITAPKALIVKLLNGTSQSPTLPSWDLMMKNVYNLGASQIQPDKFKLNIVYRNDSLGTDLRYLTEGDIKNQLLLRVMKLDKLDTKNNPHPDGKFDYVEGYTVISSNGNIIFPVLEPFGSDLKEAFGDDQLSEKYVYQKLYDSILVAAQTSSKNNKFRLVGEYKGSSGSEIRLNAINVPRGSVVVTAGGRVLVENVDYTVDYTMGTVNIINTSLAESGTQIDVKLENQSMFSMQRKTLLGTHLEYQFNKDFSVGGTIMHLSETPLTTKVNAGNEPISNTIWGLNTSWRGESQWLTNMINKIPFVNATAPSTIAINAEFAQLIPGHSKVVSSAGLAYIDDFESTQTSHDIHYPAYWYLASTPYNPNTSATPYFAEAASRDISYGKNRALFSWYHVDPILNGDTRLTPDHLRNDNDAKSNHLTRDVLISEIFPNKETLVSQPSRITVLNLSYYPTERGPYNLDAYGMTGGKLTNPTKRWGGMMRKLDVTDFETANIEYIEFWMMDPYVTGGMDPSKSGDLYFNLGDISEDVLKDGKKFFENGLPANGGVTNTNTTVWGRVPKTQSIVAAFDNSSGARKNQDVGIDGLSNAEEFDFNAYKKYVDSVTVDPVVRPQMSNDPFSPLNDPAGDNYHFYRGTDYDNQQASILTRYKRYNGVEGNSPDASTVVESYPTAATSLPDGEDINGDNTMNEYEKYYQYHVRIKSDSMKVGMNYITDKVTSTVTLKNRQTPQVSWYQFKIPIRKYKDKVGNNLSFRSIRFMRLFLTNFQDSATLRLASLDLVRSEWRAYDQSLSTTTAPSTLGKLDIQSVNIEENATKTPVNYVLPPGISRETDPSQPQLLQQNEQSMLLRVTDLAAGDARAVYKSTSFDMRQYKRLQLFVHAEKMIDDVSDLRDGQLTCFIRLGSDMVNNYYEYEVPLRLTPKGVYVDDNSAHRQTVWYPENMFDFSFDVLTKAKLSRNKSRQNGSSDLTPFYDGNNKIRVVGNPSISDVENIMIGIRNVSNNTKSGEIWVNELRMSQFDESGGWAAMGDVAVGLSDIGTVNFSGRVETAGFGGIESNVMTRRLDDLYLMNFSSSLELGRFLPPAAKLKIPAYFSYSTETLSPKYNPMDQDILLSDALENAANDGQRDSIKLLSQTVSSTKSFTISGAKVNITSKKPRFYDPANVSVTYAYTETNQHSPEIEQTLEKTERGAIDYGFSFNPEPVEPLKNVKALDSPIFQIIKDFNFNYLPTSIGLNTDMIRQYSHTKLRDLSQASTGSNAFTDVGFSSSKDFRWNRGFNIVYDLTKSISLNLKTAMNAVIDEPEHTPEMGKQYYESWRDSVWSQILKLGKPYTYQQVFSATWNTPINKLPLLDWVNSTVSYNSDFSLSITSKSFNR